MRFVPTLPVTSEPKETREIISEATARVKPVGEEHSAVALNPARSPKMATDEEKEHEILPRLAGDRRQYCRRLENHFPLEELRSKVERRHKKQRQEDPTFNIDEEA